MSFTHRTKMHPTVQARLLKSQTPVTQSATRDDDSKPESSAELPAAKKIWWLKPHLITNLFILPLYCAIYATTPDYINFTPEFFFFGLLYLELFSFGSFLASLTYVNKKPTNRFFVIKDKYLDFLAIAAIFAYLIWFGDLLTKPAFFLSLLSGEKSNARGEISTIPGVTTLTQLSPVFIITYIYHTYILKRPKVKRYFRYFLVLIFFTLFRVFVWSERLALLETLVPAVVIFLTFSKVKNKIFTTLLFLGPPLGIGLLFVYFGITEYFRSWLAFYQYTGVSFVSFISERVLSYYNTSIFNGVGLLTYYSWPRYEAQFLMNWWYKFPVLGTYFGKNVHSILPEFLSLYADPEFNTPSGIFPVYFDLGVMGAMIHGIVFGYVCGYLYATYVRLSGLGVILFPVFFVSITELLRNAYISQSRAFPIVAFAVVGYVFFKQFITLPSSGHVEQRST